MKFEHSLRMRYFAEITDKDYKFFNKFRTGDLVTRLTNDLTDFPKIAWFLCSGIFRAFNSLVNIIFIMVYDVLFELETYSLLSDSSARDDLCLLFGKYISGKEIY